MPDWPQYQRETRENLATGLDDAGSPVEFYEVQVVPYPGRPVSGGWLPKPYRIQGLTPGKYNLFTRWSRDDGQQVVDKAGPTGQPSFEVV
jgi:hypothetical protein